MSDKEMDRTTVKNQEQMDQPTTADLARAMDHTPAEDKTAPAHRVPGDTGTREEGLAPLFAKSEIDQLHSRWTDIQASFVDEPRQAVQEADALVAQVIKQLADHFASTRSNLEGQWSRGDNVSTEDLRQALRSYRSFFDRLLSL